MQNADHKILFESISYAQRDGQEALPKRLIIMSELRISISFLSSTKYEKISNFSIKFYSQISYFISRDGILIFYIQKTMFELFVTFDIVRNLNFWDLMLV